MNKSSSLEIQLHSYQCVAVVAAFQYYKAFILRTEEGIYLFCGGSIVVPKPSTVANSKAETRVSLLPRVHIFAANGLSNHREASLKAVSGVTSPESATIKDRSDQIKSDFVSFHVMNSDNVYESHEPPTMNHLAVFHEDGQQLCQHH